MSRALPIKQKQITAICKGAEKAGFIAELIIGDVVVRLIPERLAQEQKPMDEEEDIRL